ncbi:phytoene desaturase family protein [Mycobacterium paraterrae]|uniref:Pyridine nucleotide-disulfide oxidoreductase domain-containing protein 2 n=1 Tax=Mycobacterium paraterrae TaxID=577492 RepID=A0ABY3VM79_9MYCO|nr:NAD(P)/FAD-dependent oxidoreductase [Mycobacterium paraterrae]UMB70545.1 NAD(P)/FAD-dependent oxidoreductase [Mycobacterium paraterrae]
MAARDVDAVIVGGGHNGLVAAAYLTRAGLRVQLLERLPHVGGAAVSAEVFPGVAARLSQYAYLVSLLPTRILTDLGATVQLAPRPYSSYTPDPATAGRTGLLVGRESTFGAIGAGDDERAFAELYRRCRVVTCRLWPTLLEPLRTREQARLSVGADDIWRDMIERPIGAVIAQTLGNDVVRGVVATDALIGTFARLDDPSLQQNVCFLYHLLGGGDGGWHVPVGGMGAVSAALVGAAEGADIVTGAEVYAITPGGEVRYRRGDDEHLVRARFVLSGVTPTTLAGLLGEPAPASAPGAQVKVNMVLTRLPRLRDENVSPAQAFSGTFHVNETWTQLDSAYSRASAGVLPDPLPCEIYCHSLTDPSIVSPALRESGAMTLTVFGLHTPHPLFDREALTDAVLKSLNSVLAEPIQDLVMADANGSPCIETTTTTDLERRLGMTAGNIFHGGLAWPFADDDDPLDTPARRWGVATAHERILLCGSGARRGGAVSGIGGHNAAMAVLGLL